MEEDKFQQKFEQQIAKYHIIMDASALLHSAQDKFWLNAIPYLRKYKRKILVLKRVYNKVLRMRNNDDVEISIRATKVGAFLPKLEEKGFVEILDYMTEEKLRNILADIIDRLADTKKLMIATQWNDFAEQLYKTHGNKITIKRVNKYGYFGSYNDIFIPQKLAQKSTPIKIPEHEKFMSCKYVTNLSNAPLNISEIPKLNDTVYTKNGSLRLIKELGTGGEGSVYQTTINGFVAKIYNAKSLTQRKFEKIKIMLNKSLNCDGICFPSAGIYNSKKEFVGYLMPSAKGVEIQRSLFLKPLFQKKFPVWKKRDLVELCVTILTKIKYLHDRNILIGDINPANILIISQKQICLVDTDSYQIENFPCVVGMANFTAPEIQGKKYSEFLRTIGNENFAVATLLFMIMLPGKPPYAKQGGESAVKNIMEMDFSYPLGEKSNKKAPEGLWRYMWSHLPVKIKTAFYETFAKGGEYSTEQTRLNSKQWLELFKWYLNHLDKGTFDDPMSYEIYPTRTKIWSDKQILLKCKNCGTEFVAQKNSKFKPNLCFNCYKNGNKVKEKRICKDCGKEFIITQNDYKFYMKMGYDLPKRCKDCRKNK